MDYSERLKTINMKKILITGARGYIGSFLLKELKSKYEVIGTSLHEDSNTRTIPLDIRKREVVFKYLSDIKPDIIIHAGAISNVKICEENSVEAFETNVQGTYNIVEAANKINAKVIFISSLASKNLSNVYGKNKFDAENLIKTVNSGYEILQLSMTFGFSPNTTSHRPFNKILNTLQTGFPKVYDNHWKFQPTYIKHLFFIIEQLLEEKFLGRCLPIITKESCTMYQIASDILPNNIIIEKGNLYSSRKEEIIILNESLKSDFPTWSYNSIISDIKKNLEIYQLNNS